MDVENAPLISKLQNLDIMAYLPFDILTKVDIASMANSLEVRTPLLDHILVEAAAAMPSQFKLREEKTGSGTLYESKYILRRLAKRRYPPDVTDRKKMGFGIPLGKWFAAKLKDDVRNRLLCSDYFPVLFNMEEITKIVNSHSARSDHSTNLWNLLFLEEWMRSHYESIPMR
jgi:asparagine synthase (glutamine-hydrolysing)